VIARSFSAVILLATAACTGTAPPAASGAGGEPPAPASAEAIQDRTWTLIQLGKAPLIVTGDAPRPTLTLKSPEGLAQGMGGCNRFSGTYELQGRSLRFGPLISTKMACPRLDTETAYMSALEQTRSWSFIDGLLELLDADAKPLARFEAPNPAS
jgi:heat shock protein HslJ